MEVKTNVAMNILGASLELLRPEDIFCNVGDDICHRFIPRDHVIQVVQQVTVMKTSVIIYSAASENWILYTMPTRLTTTTRVAIVNSLNKVSETVVNWAHKHDGTLPSFIRPKIFQAVKIR